MDKLRAWAAAHPNWWEFIKFNVLSNVATLTNFLVLFVTTTFLFPALSDTPCLLVPLDFLGQGAYLFRYPAAPEGTGLCGFLGFLCAYVCAQAVNYVVQRRLVFGATVAVGRTMGWYVATVVTAGLICQVWSGYGTGLLMEGLSLGQTPAALLTNVINILIQVALNYPMMKFVVMRKN